MWVFQSDLWGITSRDYNGKARFDDSFGRIKKYAFSFTNKKMVFYYISYLFHSAVVSCLRLFVVTKRFIFRIHATCSISFIHNLRQLGSRVSPKNFQILLGTGLVDPSKRRSMIRTFLRKYGWVRLGWVGLVFSPKEWSTNFEGPLVKGST